MDRADLTRIAMAYEIAATRCSAMYRPNGKPFVCHLVGTASILYSVGAPMTVVTAGLLHSVYKHGDFGRGAGRFRKKERTDLRRAVGDAVEDLVYRYTHFEWDHSRLDEMVDRLPSLSDRSRDVLLMRLADLLDDHVDLGRLYERSASKEAERRGRRDSYSRLARAAGYPELAAAMDRFSADMETVNIEEGMILDQYGRSFYIPPASYRERLPVRMAGLPTAALKQVRRVGRRIRRWQNARS